MSGTQTDKQVEQEEVQLATREENLPAIKTSISTPHDNFKGFRFRSYFDTTAYYKLTAKQIHYQVWKEHPWVRALVDKFAKMAITIGWDISYKGEGKANSQIINSITNFFEYPNYKESFNDILWKTVIQLKLFWESFWEIVKDEETGYPVDFWILDGVVVPIVDEHGNPYPDKPAYIQQVMQNTASFDFNEIIHFTFLDPMGNLRPAPELEALEFSILLDIYAMQLNRQSFISGVRKGKAFIFPSDTGEENMKRNREAINNLHQGILGAYSAFCALEGECTIQDLQLIETTMEAKELREYLRDEISAVIGTPLVKVGLKITDVKENEYLDRAYFQEEVKPLLGIIQDSINRYLDLIGVMEYRFRFRDFPIRDLKEIARMVDVLKKHGAISTNEIRNMIGLPPLSNPESNKPYFIMEGNSIVFSEEIGKEKIKRDAQNEKAVAQGQTFLFNTNPKRQILRKGIGGQEVLGKEKVSNPFLK